MTLDTRGGVDLINIRHPMSPSTFRMAFFPHLLDSSVRLLDLAELLLPTVEVLAFQYPGAYDFDGPPRIGGTAELADRAFGTLMAWTDRPLALFGHRVGADVAYEVARRLEQEAGVVPATLFISGRGGPARTGPELRCPVVALTREHSPRALVEDVRSWESCTTGPFSLEVLPRAHGGPDGYSRQVANLVHDQLISGENKGL
ncbi:thioesterase II family protein [Kitasatospora sp. NPDC091335]|uniref:thioesterase II family protein n=1 Tax=Kitasatospora sp. NPDC091335 TaxID=3364085 RepID=UPI0037FC39BB